METRTISSIDEHQTGYTEGRISFDTTWSSTRQTFELPKTQTDDINNISDSPDTQYLLKKKTDVFLFFLT